MPTSRPQLWPHMSPHTKVFYLHVGIPSSCYSGQNPRLLLQPLSLSKVQPGCMHVLPGPPPPASLVTPHPGLPLAAGHTLACASQRVLLTSPVTSVLGPGFYSEHDSQHDAMSTEVFAPSPANTSRLHGSKSSGSQGPTPESRGPIREPSDPLTTSCLACLPPGHSAPSSGLPAAPQKPQLHPCAQPWFFWARCLSRS